MPRYRLGVDVGGTHTDIVAADGTTGALVIEKIPSTPDNPARRNRESLQGDLEEGYVTRDSEC